MRHSAPLLQVTASQKRLQNKYELAAKTADDWCVRFGCLLLHRLTLQRGASRGHATCLRLGLHARRGSQQASWPLACMSDSQRGARGMLQVPPR